MTKPSPELPPEWAQYADHIEIVDAPEGAIIRPSNDGPEAKQAMQEITLELYRALAARSLTVDDDYPDHLDDPDG